MEIELSIMAPTAAGIQPLLDQFEAETGIHVRLRLLAWDSAWGMFVRAALYGDGPDVSEVGTTWIGDLVGMNALRPFDAVETAAMGRAGAFLPIAWKTAAGPDADQETAAARVWSIPWLAGARLICYRPALLAQAGVDPARDFATTAGFTAAVERLAQAGIPVPWTVPTGYTHTTLLNIASWVWGAGGDFVRADGRATAFMEPEALRGLAEYYALGRWLAAPVRGLNGLEPDDYFRRHPGAALTMSGPWLFNQPPELPAGEMGVTLPPGPSFVGGSNLTIWKYTRAPEAAVRLVRFLTQPPALAVYGQAVGLLPARVEALQAPPYTRHPLWSTAARGLVSGRTFPTIRLWGLLEDRLTAAFSAVWTDVLAGSAPAEALTNHLAPLAERLDPLLARG